MSDVSESKKKRRSRLKRSGNPRAGMTPIKMRLLHYVAECGFLTTRQAALIMGMKRDAVYAHLSALYELDLMDRFIVPYASVAPPGEDGPNIAYGPSENFHRASRLGLRYLLQMGRISEELESRKLPDYGARNSLFLAHEVLVRDVRVWLEMCSRANGGHVEQWADGTAAHLPPARPDAWFVYGLPNGRALVGLVEADRGTERGPQWEWKARDYKEMLAGTTLARATGGNTKARLVIVTQSESRRERIAELLSETSIAAISFVATQDDIRTGGLERPIWNNPLEPYLVPLVPPHLLE